MKEITLVLTEREAKIVRMLINQRIKREENRFRPSRLELFEQYQIAAHHSEIDTLMDLLEKIPSQVSNH